MRAAVVRYALLITSLVVASTALGTPSAFPPQLSAGDEDGVGSPCAEPNCGGGGVPYTRAFTIFMGEWHAGTIGPE